ncbi:MAG: hypothetical protein ACE5ER_01885 [Nitrospinaceae bacterium]
MNPNENIFNYRNHRWFRANLAFLAILLVFYFLDHPLAGRRGDTVIGYAYGAVATLGILLLMVYGIRKRSYHSTVGTLVGWLSSHLWLGVSLIIIVPLHSGFQFGNNIHTLAYGFLVATILSGVWGALNYVRYPRHILSNRGGESAADLVEQIRMIDADLKKLERGKSDKFVGLMNYIDKPVKTNCRQIIFSRSSPEFKGNAQIKKLILELPPEEQENGIKVLNIIEEKIRLINLFENEMRAHFWLKVWLFFHLPLSLGLLVTLGIHIFSVFYYW